MEEARGGSNGVAVALTFILADVTAAALISATVKGQLVLLTREYLKMLTYDQKMKQDDGKSSLGKPMDVEGGNKNGDNDDDDDYTDNDDDERGEGEEDDPKNGKNIPGKDKGDCGPGANENDVEDEEDCKEGGKPNEDEDDGDEDDDNDDEDNEREEGVDEEDDDEGDDDGDEEKEEDEEEELQPLKKRKK